MVEKKKPLSMPVKYVDASVVVATTFPCAFVESNAFATLAIVKFEVVAFVVVEFKIETLLSVDDPAAMRPFVKARVVEVALFGKRYAKPPVLHDCVVTTPVAVIVRHCPACVLRLEITRLVVEAVVAVMAVVDAYGKMLATVEVEVILPAMN